MAVIYIGVSHMLVALGFILGLVLGLMIGRSISPTAQRYRETVEISLDSKRRLEIANDTLERAIMINNDTKARLERALESS